MRAGHGPKRGPDPDIRLLVSTGGLRSRGCAGWRGGGPRGNTGPGDCFRATLPSQVGRSGNQELKPLHGTRSDRVWGRCHARGPWCGTRRAPQVMEAHRNCAGRLHQFALLFDATASWEARAMQLSQMWREHLQAGCPPEIRSFNIAGTSARELDAEITACVSACVTHSLKM